jgi:hypothetical protein
MAKQETTPLELATLQPAANAVALRPQPTVADMLQAVIDKGVTSDNVAAMGELVKLYERMEDKKAEKEFAAAFVRLQAETRTVKATKAVPNNDGSVRYNFAPFEEIMAAVGPILERNGFTVAFSTDFAESRLIKICHLTHIGGHTRENKFAVRIGKGPPGSSEAQGDGAASTYAKRFALCDALNIVVEKDSDARVEGGTITSDQAQELSRRVQEGNRDREKFLKFAGAKTFAEIPAAKYAILDEELSRLERKGK